MKRALLMTCAFGMGAAVMASPAHASTDAKVQGFGSDMPLSTAVQQVVPHDYTVVYGAGIDPSASVNWHGGESWQSVLRTMAPHGKHLSVAVGANTVTLSNADAAYDGPATAMPMASSTALPAAAVPAASTRGMRSRVVEVPYSPASVGGTRGLIMVPYHAQAAADTVAPDAGMEQSQPAVMTPPPPPPAAVVAPPPPPPPAPVVSAMPAALPEPPRAPPPAIKPIEPVPPLRAVREPVAAVPVAPLPARVAQADARTDMGSADQPDAGVMDSNGGTNSGMSARERRAQAAAQRAEEHEQARTAAARPNPMPASIPTKVTSRGQETPSGVMTADGRMWVAHQGATLDQVLGDWADRAHWKLVFHSKMIYELEASAEFEGNFEQAAKSLVLSVRASPVPFAHAYYGNKTLVIDNQPDQAN